MSTTANVNSILDRIPATAGYRVLDAVVALDEQLTTQKKVREAERAAFRKDVFVRSRELESLLARRQAQPKV